MNRIKIRIDKQSVVWSLAMTGVTAGFVWFAMRPQFKQMAELRTTITREQSELTAGQNSPESIARLQDEVNQLSRRTVRFEAQIPTEADLGGFLQKLAEVAQSRNLRPDSIKPGQPIVLAGVTSLPIAVRIRGPFPAIFQWLKDIEQIPRLTQVERCVITAEKDTGSAVSAELDFRVFFRASQQETVKQGQHG